MKVNEKLHEVSGAHIEKKNCRFLSPSVSGSAVCLKAIDELCNLNTI